MQGNVFGNRTTNFGGGFEIYRSVGENQAFGGVIDRLPSTRPYVILGGTPMKNYADGTIKVLNSYRVIEASSSATVKVLKSEAVAVPVVGWAIMKAPSTLNGTGKAVSVDAVVDDDTYYTLTLSADLGSLNIGDLLCDAAAVGADEAAYCVPDTLTRRDAFLFDGDEKATATGVLVATVFANRIPLYPSALEAACKNINFEKNI